MLRRIGIWALCGFAVALVWFLIILAVPRGQGPSLNWPIVYITMAPVALLGHRALTYYQSFVINATGYALMGLMVELIIRPFRSSVAKRHV